MENADEFDLIVIGGGVSGLGVLQAACRIGLKACLIEKGTIGGETSANSLRIIHGGIRYLQHLNFPRVLRSCKAQAALVRQYPENIKPLNCYMPLTPYGLKSKIPVSISLLMYNTIRAFSGCSDVLAQARVVSDLGDISKSISSHGYLNWVDAKVLDPHLLAQSIASEIRNSGGLVIEQTRVADVQKSNAVFMVQTVGSKAESNLRAKKVVNCTGPYLDSFPWREHLLGRKPEPLKWCRAFNLVVRQSYFGDSAFGLQTSGGRLLFVTPRELEGGLGSAIGTWYLPLAEGQYSTELSEMEIADALSDTNQVIPGANLSSADIISIECGVLPTKSFSGNEPTLYGSEQIRDYHGYIEVLSTKYTTFQSQAEVVLELIQS